MPCSAEQGADGSHHAGNITIVEHDDVPVQDSFEVEVVDAHEPYRLITEYRAFHGMSASSAGNPHGDRIQKITRFIAARFHHTNVALSSEVRRIDVVHGRFQKGA